MSKVRFSHPTKTGGSSVVRALKEEFDYVRHNHKPLCTKAQAKAQDISYAFATVRNPYDRVLDMYNYFKRVNEVMTLGQFVRDLEAGIHKGFWFFPQHVYVRNADFEVNDLMRIETFEDDWKRIINSYLGIETEMLHVNKTKIIKRKNLTVRQKEIVYDVYKEDFKLLGYSK